MKVNNIDIKLLQWYFKNGDHTLPWRLSPTPYKTWISEIMLQQTQVKTVIPYFLKWMKLYPNINILSKTSIDKLLILWQGLGYYKRVENILDSAKTIKEKHSNIFPNNYIDLIDLKGIGDYTASAILAIAYNKYSTPIDGNIKRILSRLYMLPPKKQTSSEYKKKLTAYINKTNPGDSIQALMDIGRTICKPKNPLCPDCPLSTICKGYKYDAILFYPYKIKKITPTYNIVVGFILRDKKFIITKRLKNKLLGNLWELPGGKIKNKETASNALIREITEELDIQINKLYYIGKVKHQYSHFKIKIKLYQCAYLNGTAKALQSQAYQWITTNQIKDFAFPRATHKLFQLINEYYENDI